MDEQYAETGGAHGIDEGTLFDVDILEPDEGAECHKQGEKLVAVVNVLVYHEGGVLKDDHRQHGTNDRQQGEPSPQATPLEDGGRVEADV